MCVRNIHTFRMIELVVGEMEKHFVELKESQHHFEINISRDGLLKLVRRDPCDLLSEYLCLVVDALDGEEHLLECLLTHDVSHELLLESLAVLNPRVDEVVATAEETG